LCAADKKNKRKTEAEYVAHKNTAALYSLSTFYRSTPSIEQNVYT